MSESPFYLWWGWRFALTPPWIFRILPKRSSRPSFPSREEIAIAVPNSDTHNRDNMAEQNPEDVPTETLDDEPKSILLGIISQLKKGMDLSRVTLPTFVLEPRSMLEKISDFMTHPDLLYQYLVSWCIEKASELKANLGRQRRKIQRNVFLPLSNTTCQDGTFDQRYIYRQRRFRSVCMLMQHKGCEKAI